MAKQTRLLLSSLIEDTLNHFHQSRNVLIVEDKPSIRRVFHVLLAGLGCEGDIAHNGYLALSMIEKESLDALLLDLRYSEIPAGEMASPIKELRPKLVGKVLVIAGEVSDPRIMKVIKKNCWSYISWRQFVQDLWERLRSLLGFSQSRRRLLLQPSPLGHGERRRATLPPHPQLPSR